MTRTPTTFVVALGFMLLPSVSSAQSGRFQGMDRNHDGVITRAEWRGSDQSFRQHDLNNDGVLVGTELNAADSSFVRDFSIVDLDGNGFVTAQEWRRAFSQLDVNRDGALTEDELQARSRYDLPGDNRWNSTESAAFRAGRERGILDGRQAGREDAARGVWDLEGQRELEQADAGYRSELGSREQYQAGYREGFRAAYADGYGARR
jgi:EF hand